MINEEAIAVVEVGALSGSNTIKVSDGVCTFISKLKFCTQRGDNIEYLTPIEFKHIVGIKKIK